MASKLISIVYIQKVKLDEGQKRIEVNYMEQFNRFLCKFDRISGGFGIKSTFLV